MNNWLRRLACCLFATFLFSVHVHAEVVTVEGVLKAVDAKRRTVSVDIDGQAKEFDVSRKLKVVINGEERALEDLKEGTTVKVSYHDDLEIALRIEGVSAKEPTTPSSGSPPTVAKESDPEKIKEVLDWVFSKGGDVSYVGPDGQEVRGIQDTDDLPEGTHVTGVNLFECEKLGDHQLERLVSFSNIKNLSLMGVKDLSDDDLKDVGLIKGLESVNIAVTPLNGNGFRHLKNCQRLRELYCGGTPIKDISLTHLKKIPSLRLLGLIDTKVTDQGLTSLAEINLEELRLDGCRISDQGLKTLLACKTLKKLMIKRTGVSKKGVSSFRAANPDCEVVSDF